MRGGTGRIEIVTGRDRKEDRSKAKQITINKKQRSINKKTRKKQ